MYDEICNQYELLVFWMMKLRCYVQDENPLWDETILVSPALKTLISKLGLLVNGDICSVSLSSHLYFTSLICVMLTVLLTNNNVTVFSPESIRHLFILQTHERLLPCQVLQILGNHIYGIVITFLSIWNQRQILDKYCKIWVSITGDDIITTGLSLLI